MTDTSARPERRALGLALAFYALLSWGLLPVLLKVLVARIDPVTLTWYRFAASAAVIVAISGRAGIRRFRVALTTRALPVVCVAAAGLSANYVCFLSGLDLLSPGVAQTVNQVTPFLVLLGGIAFFAETLSRRQWIGVALLPPGLACFFNQRAGELLSPSSAFFHGVFLVFLGAIAWAAFMLAQKSLVNALGARTVMLACYLGGVLVLSPFVTHATVLSLDPGTLLLLVLCVSVTVTSYLAFATALKYVEASRAGLVIANIPLVTLAGNALVHRFLGAGQPDPINGLALAGAVLIVAGSTLGAAPARAAPAAIAAS